MTVAIGMLVLNIMLTVIWLSGGFKIYSKYDILPLYLRLGQNLAVFIAALFIFLYTHPDIRNYTMMVMFASFFIFIGNMLTAKTLPSIDGNLFGIGAYLTGASLFISAFIAITVKLGFAFPINIAVITASILVLWTIGAWWFVIRDVEKHPIQNMVALIFGLCMAFLTTVSIVLFIRLGWMWIGAAIGSLLIMIAVLLLGISIFKGEKKYTKIIWILFLLSQTSIIYTGLLYGLLF